MLCGNNKTGPLSLMSAEISQAAAISALPRHIPLLRGPLLRGLAACSQQSHPCTAAHSSFSDFHLTTKMFAFGFTCVAFWSSNHVETENRYISASLLSSLPFSSQKVPPRLLASSRWLPRVRSTLMNGETSLALLPRETRNRENSRGS